MAKKKTQPKKSVVRLRENCELCDIQLVESLCKKNLRDGPLPENLELGVLARAGINKAKGQIVYFPTIRAVARYDDSAPSESPLLIQAKYRVEYNLTGNISDADEQDIEEFVRNAGNLHIWPYFRELMHSMTCKMGLPGLTIPLYDPSGFIAEVTEELTKPALSQTATTSAKKPRVTKKRKRKSTRK